MILTSELRDGTVHVEGLSQLSNDSQQVRRGRVRAVLKPVEKLPTGGGIQIGWDFGEGNPRRIDAVCYAPADKPLAAIWKYGPQFEVSVAVPDQELVIDGNQPLVVDLELAERRFQVTVAGQTMTTELPESSGRRASPYLGVQGTWKLTEWRLWDLDAMP